MITNENKQNYPVTARIPAYLWKTDFHGMIDEQYVQFTQKLFTSLTREDFPEETKLAAILILNHLDIPVSDLISFIINKLDIDKKSLFIMAIWNGRLDVLKKLKEDISGIEFLNIIKEENYAIFCIPFGLGYQDVVDWFQELLADKFMEIVEQNDLMIFTVATKFGRLSVLEWLKTQIPNNFLDLVRNNNHLAAEFGQIHLLEWFKKQIPREFQKLITASDYKGLHYAAHNNQIRALDWLKAQMPSRKLLKKIKAYDYSIVYAPIEEGHIEALQWLIAQTSLSTFLKMLAARDYLAYACAARKGRLHVLQWIKDLAPQLFLTMIRANGYGAFSTSAQSGSVTSLVWFKEQAPDEFLKMVKGYNYEAFEWAAQVEHLHVLEWLKENAPSEFSNMVGRVVYNFFNKYGCHFILTQKSKLWLLQEPLCFIYAERQPENSDVIRSFIQNTLKKLHQKHDISPVKCLSNNVSESMLYLLILRYLIRCNEPIFHSEICFLLQSVNLKESADITMETGDSNVLLRTAQTSGNQEAAIELLKIDSVSRLARKNNFYEDEPQRKLDLRGLNLSLDVQYRSGYADLQGGLVRFFSPCTNVGCLREDELKRAKLICFTL